MGIGTDFFLTAILLKKENNFKNTSHQR